MVSIKDAKLLQAIIDKKVTDKFEILEILLKVSNNVKKIEQSPKKEVVEAKAKKKLVVYDTSIIDVDGGMNSITGDEAWGSVVDNNGNCLITKYRKRLKEDLKVTLKKVELPIAVRYVVVSKFNDVASQQNNGAELLAMVIGLKITDYQLEDTKSGNVADNIFSKEEMTKVIRSDSITILNTWSKGRVSDKLKKTIDPLKLEYVELCGELRKQFEEHGGKLEKVAAKENKADLGFHR